MIAKKIIQCYRCDGAGRICESCLNSECRCKTGKVVLCARCKGNGRITLAKFERENLATNTNISEDQKNHILNSNLSDSKTAKLLNISRRKVAAIKNEMRLLNGAQKSC